jgi:hypothetical protein
MVCFMTSPYAAGNRRRSRHGRFSYGSGLASSAVSGKNGIGYGVKARLPAEGNKMLCIQLAAGNECTSWVRVTADTSNRVRGH